MENQRVRLSKTMLKEGLLKLLQERPLSEITVYALCETAGINRTTFYKHYASPTDLLQDIETDFFREIDSIVQVNVAAHTNGLSAVLQYLYDQRALFCTLAQTVPAQTFAEELFAVPSVNSFFEKALQTEQITDTKKRYIRQFTYHGIFAVLCDWLTGENPERPEEMVDVIISLRRVRENRKGNNAL